MTRSTFTVALGSIVVLLALSTSAAGGVRVNVTSPGGLDVLSPALESSLADASQDTMIATVVTLGEQAELHGLGNVRNRSARLRGTIVALQSTANRTQGRILGLLRARRAQGRVESFDPYWVFNGLAVTATPAVIQELAALPEVESITLDETFTAPPADVGAALPATNIDVVDAPALWALGYTGTGAVVASLDTGVDVSHPELSSRWRGGSNSWFDPNGEHSTPVDVSGHGTWTMGVMVGGSVSGTAIGIAPDARWIAVKIFDDRGHAKSSRIHAGFQWLLDPDGDPDTPDAPNVVNNSWQQAGPGCDLQFESDLESLRAAGILPVFAAGNNGPGNATSVSPANNPAAFAVGETDNGDVVQSESSRGPSSCGESSTVYPELVAPGVGITTTDLYGSYASHSGTSLSAPHVSGALALLLGAYPDLSAEDQVAAMEAGAVDLGGPGPDNASGFGRLDALAAYESVVPTPGFTLSASPTTVTVSPGETALYGVRVTPTNGFSGDVDLTLQGLGGSNASWTFSPAAISGGDGTSQLAITTAASIPAGTYSLTVTAASGTISNTAPVTLVVSPPPDFAISLSPGAQTVKRGRSTTYTVTVSSQGGFAGAVSLTVSGLPADTSSTFSFPTVTGDSGTSTLTVTTTNRAAFGTFTLTITGTSGPISHQATATLTISRR